MVTEGDVADVRLVQTGAMYGSEWLITEGLEAGERVIVGGPAVNPGDKVTLAAPARAGQ
ncbi:periplasmic multidrug efflux lipoprotein precursor [compost metagenome]